MPINKAFPYIPRANVTTMCYISSDACLSNPCQNGGTCISNKKIFTCSCPSGYIGDTCHTFSGK